MYWVWHSMVEFTREGARYAATHCWQADSAERDDLHADARAGEYRCQISSGTGGTAQINVQYFQRDPGYRTCSNPFACDGDCSANCVPDAVTVSVTNYQFRRFVSFLHLQPVHHARVPHFHADRRATAATRSRIHVSRNVHAQTGY